MIIDKLQALLLSVSVALPALVFAEQVFCPGRNGYIQVGMTPDEVIKACGMPRSKSASSVPVMQKIEVLQLTYNNQGTDTGFYGYWNMPVSNSATGNGGGKLQVSIINNKIDSMTLNGSGVNGASICNNHDIQIGDPASSVYGACGTPSISNRTFILKPIRSRNDPIVWVYQQADYLPPIVLTFVDGRLQLIK